MNLQQGLRRLAHELDRALLVSHDETIRSVFRELSTVMRDFAAHIETTGDLASADAASIKRITSVGIAVEERD